MLKENRRLKRRRKRDPDRARLQGIAIGSLATVAAGAVAVRKLDAAALLKKSPKVLWRTAAGTLTSPFKR